MDTRYIIFSDLDGTLLDYSTYSFEAAIPALNLIREKNIPLILVSSKTREELESFQKKLKLTGLPFVVENGSAIFTLPGYFPNLADRETTDKYDSFLPGKTYEELKRILADIASKYEYKIKGFHNASREEIRRATSLKPHDLERALKRGYSIPIFFDDRSEEILIREAPAYGLRLLYGGRFMHLLGDLDKGTATRLIINGYQQRPDFDNIKTIGLGDSLNDFSMLASVDYPVLVRRHDGSYEGRETVKNLILSPYVGPEGWNYSILKLFGNGGFDE
ncbi:MAG: HAD-IIB family hydrolase [Calditrichales bacterium]|nr:MAG: HAD-IIB family hydrolase [Calditrichales bacterium]